MSEAERITLGVDPGTALLGYGILRGDAPPRVVDFGVLSTSPKQRMATRLLQLYDGLTQLVRDYRPDVVVIEELFFARNVTTALAVGQARGVVLLTAAQAGVPVVEYKPAEVKQAVAGYGKADKPQMQEMVRLLLDLDEVPQPDDAADALAVALCHVQTDRFNRAVSASEAGA
ncbi:MAG TPA: crossover junction endodeoxyribonuclease RuvC [Thermomicrobiaceae bacterium]|nr:crossover junction endodeoxyribonuclease RuvC [Thermomicrobiaceae bacterium]